MRTKLFPIGIFITLLGLVGWLNHAARSTIYHPMVTIAVQPDLRMTFVLYAVGDHAECENRVDLIARLFSTNCPSCQIENKACPQTLNEDLKQVLDESPIHSASVRMSTGVISFQSSQPEIEMAACQESEKQSLFNGPTGRATCYPRATRRPLPKQQIADIDAARQAFISLEFFIKALAVGILTIVVIQLFRRATAVSTPSNISNQHSSLGYPWTNKFFLVAVDIATMLFAYFAVAQPNAEELTRWGHTEKMALIGYLLLTAITVGFFYVWMEHYSRRRPFWDELKQTVQVVGTMLLITLATLLVEGASATRLNHSFVWALNLVLLPVGRTASRKALDLLGFWKCPAVIIGTGDNAQEAYRAVRSEPAMGYRIVGFVSPCSIPLPAATRQQESLQQVASMIKTDFIKEVCIDNEIFPILTANDGLEALLRQYGEPQIIIALDSLIGYSNQILIQYISSIRRNAHVIPALRGLPLLGTQLSHFFSHDILFLTFRHNLGRRSYRWLKRAFDLTAASLGLLLLAPVMLILSHLIRREGGTATYGHQRVGQNGRTFLCLKFRSMRPDADTVLQSLLANNPVARSEWERDFKLKNDPRITPLGHFLRKTSLDELPQLINVVKGEMSLVGPRPIVEKELERYGSNIQYYLETRPGITGLWQISGRNNTTYEHRVTLDAWYVKNWSLWYDIAILFKTVEVVFSRRGAY